MDSKAEDEKREGALSMAEPLHQGEIITIRPITIPNNTMSLGPPSFYECISEYNLPIHLHTRAPVDKET